MTLKNGAAGEVWYGMHFYPGVAEYANPETGGTFRVYLNEDTIRAMDPTFAGRPVFVSHPDDDVTGSLDKLRAEADGWVVESFYNQADGKHWAKFIVTSERGRRAVRNGMALSNAYDLIKTRPGGTWNGVSYQKEVTEAVYEHLALVPNPRYAESMILTPEQFKAYNAEKNIELLKLANEEGKEPRMKLKFFKRSKVENEIDLVDQHVVLPKSKQEVALATLIENADVAAVKAASGEKLMANSADHVTVQEQVDGKPVDKVMTVGELVKLYNEACAGGSGKGQFGKELENKKDDDEDEVENKDDVQGEKEADESLRMAEEDEEVVAKKKENAADEEKSEEDKAAEAAAAQAAEDRAKRLRNAGSGKVKPEVVKVEISADMVQRGKSRYGS